MGDIPYEQTKFEEGPSINHQAVKPVYDEPAIRTMQLIKNQILCYQ